LIYQILSEKNDQLTKTLKQKGINYKFSCVSPAPKWVEKEVESLIQCDPIISVDITRQMMSYIQRVIGYFISICQTKEYPNLSFLVSSLSSFGFINDEDLKIIVYFLYEIKPEIAEIVDPDKKTNSSLFEKPILIF
jgi:hypothetical protein